MEFDVVSEDKWEEIGDNFKLDVPREYFLCVPKYATITEIHPPLNEGYYVMPGSANVYRKEDSMWSVRTGFGWENTSIRTDAYMSANKVEFLAPIVKE